MKVIFPTYRKIAIALLIFWVTYSFAIASNQINTKTLILSSPDDPYYALAKEIAHDDKYILFDNRNKDFTIYLYSNPSIFWLITDFITDCLDTRIIFISGHGISLILGVILLLWTIIFKHFYSQKIVRRSYF